MKIITTQLFKEKDESGKLIEQIMNLEDQSNFEEILQQFFTEQDFFLEVIHSYSIYTKKEINYQIFRTLSLKALHLYFYQFR